MSDQAAPEPTMEEILASIRRIISEDEVPAGSEPAKADDGQWRPPPSASDANAEAAAAEDDVLQLNTPVAAVTAEMHGDVEVFDRPASAAEAPAQPVVEPEPEPAPPPPAALPPVAAAPAPAPAAASLIGADAAQRSASAFGKLTAATRVEAPAAPALPSAGRTLEDLTREALAPLLKAWLDENLPRIVQARVDEEVERIARGRVG